MCLKNYFLNDLPIHKGKRKRLVETLISKGITDKKVLNAILNIPRHFFMDSDFQSFAYDDKAFPILSNQTISISCIIKSRTTETSVPLEGYDDSL